MLPHATTPSATRVGQGVSLAAIDPRLLETPPPLKPEEDAQEDQAKVKWLETPSIANQQATRPDSVRLGEFVSRIFDLAKEDDLKAYNELRSKQRPVDPSIAEVHIDRRFIKASSSWVVLFEYRKVEYKQLIPAASKS